MLDWEWFPDPYPSSFLVYYCFIRAGNTCRNFDEHNGSKMSNRTGSYPTTESHEHSLHRLTKGGIQSKWINNTNTRNNEASGWDPVWILFHDNYYTNKRCRLSAAGYSIRTSETFYLYEYNVAPPRVVPGRVLP